jgi:hypothetical protein
VDIIEASGMSPDLTLKESDMTDNTDKFTVSEFDRLCGMIRDARAMYKRARSNRRNAADKITEQYWESNMREALLQIERASACLHADCRREAERMSERMSEGGAK